MNMKPIYRLIFIVLFFPACLVNSIWDVIGFILKGKDHNYSVILNYLADHLLE